MERTLLIILAVGLFYIADKYFDWNPTDLLPPQEVKVRTLTKGELAALPKPIKIPAEVYEENTPRSAWAKGFFGDKKTAFLLSPTSNCPYATSRTKLKHLLRRPDMKEHYRKEIKKFSGMLSVQCNTYNCAKLYLLNTCSSRLCIINPQKREIVVSESADISVIAALLEKYKNW